MLVGLGLTRISRGDGMNLAALTLFVLIGGATLAIAPLLARSLRYDVLPVLILLVVLDCFGVGFVWAFRRRGQYPWCKIGCRRITNSDIVPGAVGALWITFKCVCGRQYRLEGNRFLILHEDGTTSRYKIRQHRCSCWTDDTD